MKRSKNPLAVLLILVTCLGGCFRAEVATASCEDLEKITDPAAKADLEKRCGRGGPDFKPSSGKTW